MTCNKATWLDSNNEQWYVAWTITIHPQSSHLDGLFTLTIFIIYSIVNISCDVDMFLPQMKQGHQLYPVKKSYPKGHTLDSVSKPDMLMYGRMGGNSSLTITSKKKKKHCCATRKREYWQTRLHHTKTTAVWSGEYNLQLTDWWPQIYCKTGGGRRLCVTTRQLSCSPT